MTRGIETCRRTESRLLKQNSCSPTLPVPMLRHPETTTAAGARTRLMRHRSFVRFWCARTSTTGAYQMLAVAIGWQIYDLTNNPFDLGIVGLMQFIPLVTLGIFVGQIADRY